MNNDETLTCQVCDNTIKEDDDFCPECGTILIEDVFCENHRNISAEGVCIICTIPFCKICGVKINSHFLCNQHTKYEIYEGMARVYGAQDDNTAHYAKSLLEENGIHAVLFWRNQILGEPRSVYPFFQAGGGYLGNRVNEIKLMVPCQEVLKAEEVLKSLDII